MARNMLPSLFYTLLLTLLALNCHCQEVLASDGKKIHIVYMGERPKEGVFTSSMHHRMLEDVLGSRDSAKESLVYSYGRSFNGFAARLSDDEVERFSEMEGVVSVLPNTKLKLHTTRSWDFMGFTHTQTPRSSYESDVVVALLDTGVWPESESFNDDGFGPPPKSWKGVCQGANNFTCNNKIIGARFYNSDDMYDESDIRSPRDSEGHGSHTASTAAGRDVPDTSYYGLAEGVARGAVPQARIAVYKVCWYYGCSTADILAAFDDAIADGVHVISVSLGTDFPLQYFEDPIAIGAFHAMKYGILTSNSAGNSGPFPYSVANYAPWSLTVAASSIDRKFVSQVVLGNGQIFLGTSINSFALIGTQFPLIYGGDAANVSVGASGDISKYCIPSSLNSYKTQGKIVLCDTLWDGSGVLMANGLGTIMSDIETFDFSFSFPLPATVISADDGKKALDYIKSTSNPTATILKAETWTDVLAPTVVSFSSRGPNPITPDILKPDLTAPGVDILAAWSPVSPPSVYYADERSVNYNVISGTSMSCPHVSGAAAYVKSVHPSWSPAAIKSALMTTADVMNSEKNNDAEFAYGSGHINPLKAVDPGLVFDASETDYANFLCNQGYNTTTLRLVTGDLSSCSGKSSTGNAWNLNYPSFSLAIPDGKPVMDYFTRTVTNVGSPNTTYYATVYAPSSLKVTVQPSTLSFTSTGEQKTFVVKVSGGVISQVPIISSSILWRDGSHLVRSPLVVYTVLPSSSNTMPTKNQLSFDGAATSLHDRNGILGSKKLH